MAFDLIVYKRDGTSGLVMFRGAVYSTVLQFAEAQRACGYAIKVTIKDLTGKVIRVC